MIEKSEAIKPEAIKPEEIKPKAIKPEAILVFSGGGITGWTFIGALRALEEHHLVSTYTGYAGCSIGAIMATLTSIGYTSYELTKLFREFDYSKLADMRFTRLLTEFGLDSGVGIIRFLNKAIKRKTGINELTFRQHYIITGKYLRISASCLETDRPVYYSVRSHPKMKVTDALRRSFSVPYLFSAIKDQGKTYIDGGYHQSLPINGLPTDTTLCICITRIAKAQSESASGSKTDKEAIDMDIDKEAIDKQPKEQIEEEINSLPPVIQFTMKLFEGIYKYARHTRYQQILDNGYKVISIPCTSDSFLDFELSLSGQQELIALGYKHVNAYLAKSSINNT